MMRNLLAKKSACHMIIAGLVAWGGSACVYASTTQASSKSASGATHKRSTHKTTTSTGTSGSASARAGAKSSVSKTTGAKGSKKRTRTKKVKGQQAPTSDRITQIQEALAGKGVFEGSPTGVWDDSTSTAVRKFQSSNGLNPSGKLDALTLQKLGLGSETAGVAPPIVPPDTENRLRSSSTPASSSAEPR